MNTMGEVMRRRWYSQSKSEYRRSTAVLDAMGASCGRESAVPGRWFHVAATVTRYRRKDCSVGAAGTYGAMDTLAVTSMGMPDASSWSRSRHGSPLGMQPMGRFTGAGSAGGAAVGPGIVGW